MNRKNEKSSGMQFRVAAIGLFCGFLLYGSVLSVHAEEKPAENSWGSEASRSEYYNQWRQKPSEEYVQSQTSGEAIWNDPAMSGVRNFTQGVQNTWNGAVEGGKNAWNQTVEGGKNLWNQMVQGSQNLYNGTVKQGQNISNGVKNVWNNVPEAAKEDANTLFGPTSTMGSKVLTTLGGNESRGIKIGKWDVTTGDSGGVFLDAKTVYDDGKKVFFDGGHDKYESDTMNTFTDVVTVSHDLIVVEGYIGKVTGEPELAAEGELLGTPVGITKDFISTNMAADVGNWIHDHGGKYVTFPTDALIRGGQNNVAVMFGGDSYTNDKNTQNKGEWIYITKGRNAYQHFVDETLNNDSDLLAAKARAAAARARAKDQGNKNQAAKEDTPIGKPNIYLYPEETMEVSVLFAYPEALTKVIPDYRDGFFVTASPDGILTDGDGQEYDYLFYESENPDFSFQTKEAYLLPAENRADALRTLLFAYGMNERETEDFVEFWDEVLKDGVDYLMYPQDMAIVDAVMPVIITPEPEYIFRIWFLFHELIEEEDVDYGASKAAYRNAGDGKDAASGLRDFNVTRIEDARIEPFLRSGYTVVEWGGFFR